MTPISRSYIPLADTSPEYWPRTWQAALGSKTTLISPTFLPHKRCPFYCAWYKKNNWFGITIRYTIGRKNLSRHSSTQKWNQNQSLFTEVFPRSVSATCNYFKFWFALWFVCVLCYWLELLFWFWFNCDTQLQTALFHNIINNSNLLHNLKHYWQLLTNKTAKLR